MQRSSRIFDQIKMPTIAERGFQMAYFIFDNKISTLQLGFSPTAPEFLLMSEDSLPFGEAAWAIFETVSEDGWFRPGETVGFVAVDSQWQYTVSDVISVTYVGLVDIDNDTFFDGIVLERLGSEFVLTDESPYIDFLPFSTEVVASVIAIEGSGGTAPPPGTPTTGNDTITGTAGRDVIRALAGNDMVDGLGGNDKLFGQGGRDGLYGGGGRDVLNGGAGNDYLVGGKGNDKLIGGAGKDVFSFRLGHGSDTVRDFDLAGDHFQIQNGASSFGDLTFQARTGGSAFLFGNVEVFVEGITKAELQDPGLFIF